MAAARAEAPEGGTQKTASPKAGPLWRTHDLKAQKAGQRGTIYSVGKRIVGEDGSRTGAHQRGGSYSGEWRGDRKEGYGTQVYPSGDKYEGQWLAGLRHGEGTLWVLAGKSQKLRKLYVGTWQEDRQHGQGTCFFRNGELYQGVWDRGTMHGDGMLRYTNGDMYIGEWHGGVRSGQGTLNRANGDCYEGHWLDDKREGSGSHFYAASGKVFVGEWAGDVPRAGVFTQAAANPEQAAAVPTTTALPGCRLAFPADVLEGALAAVRSSRQAHRARATPIGRLFADHEVAALRDAFRSAQRPDGTAGPAALRSLCSQLGVEVSKPRLERLLAALDLVPGSDLDSAGAVSLKFEEFLRVVAVLLEEESAPNAGPSQVDESQFDSTADFLGDTEFK